MSEEDQDTNVECTIFLRNKHIKLRLLRTRAYICGFVELCNLLYFSLTIHSSDREFILWWNTHQWRYGISARCFYPIARVLRYFDKLTLLDPTDPPGRWRNTAPIDCGSLNKTIETLWYTISIYMHGGTGKFPIPVAISTGRLPLPPEKRLATG